MLIYFLIFIFKVLEEALRTLRIIVVANGKKKLGAILQFFIALIWIVLTGTVITNIKKDPLKIFFFAFGSLIGSYVGSVLEEKIALGTNIVVAKIDSVNAYKIKLRLKYKITSVNDGNKVLLMITCPRKKTTEVIDLIKSYDNTCNVFCEKIKSFT